MDKPKCKPHPWRVHMPGWLAKDENPKPKPPSLVGKAVFRKRK